MKKFLLLPLLYLMSISAIAEMHKMSDSGEILALESEAWSCVLDDEQSLVWEVKSEEEGVRYSLNTYTWFDGESDTLINTDFFPNTQKNTYWTSDSVKNSPKLAFEVPFFYGGSKAREKTIDTFVRLVRSAD